MPIIKSAKKRMRQARSATIRNLRFKRDLKAAQKSLKDAISNNKKDVTKEFQAAQSIIDTAVKKNLMHKNKAARNKSQLAKLVKESKSSVKSSPSTSKKPKTSTKKPAKPKTKSKKTA